MSLSLRFAARSDVGLLRDGNEDSGYAGPQLLVVADGMGGHAAGEVASATAVATLAPLDDDTPGPDLLGTLARAAREANARLRDMVHGDGALEGMGTTLTALLWAGTRLALLHIGDSRGYLLRDGSLVRITHDHTFVQTLVDEGRISVEDAGHHPQRSLLLRALDGRDEVELDLSIREVRAGDRYLLCSDGLSGVVSDETLERTLSQGTPDQVCRSLIDLALRAGGPDNITCVVAEVIEGDPHPSGRPIAVGAVGQRPRGRRAALRTPAARAAVALGRMRDDESDPPPDPPPARRPSRWRWARRLLLLALLTALLVGGGVAAYAWSQEQYYVGSDEGGRVVIYQGLSQTVGGIHLSSVHERQNIAVDDLPALERAAVDATISAQSLDDARDIVERLREKSVLCTPEAQTSPEPGPSGSPSPSPAPAPRPDECEEPIVS